MMVAFFYRKFYIKWASTRQLWMKNNGILVTKSQTSPVQLWTIKLLRNIVSKLGNLFHETILIGPVLEQRHNLKQMHKQYNLGYESTIYKQRTYTGIYKGLHALSSFLAHNFYCKDSYISILLNSCFIYDLNAIFSWWSISVGKKNQ